MKFKLFILSVFALWCFTVNFVFVGSCHTCNETIQFHTQNLISTNVISTNIN